jgi:hypothetical protein
LSKHRKREKDRLAHGELGAHNIKRERQRENKKERLERKKEGKKLVI